MITKIRNCCYCKTKKDIRYLNPECPARFHTGKKSVLKIDFESLERERIERSRTLVS